MSTIMSLSKGSFPDLMIFSAVANTFYFMQVDKEAKLSKHPISLGNSEAKGTPVVGGGH